MTEVEIRTIPRAVFTGRCGIGVPPIPSRTLAALLPTTRLFSPRVRHYSLRDPRAGLIGD
jgi:hypothetical protein